MLEAPLVDSASPTSISTSCWELFCPLIDCTAWLIITKRSTWFIPNVASIFRWLYVKQPGHHDWCRAHARRRVGHFVLSLGPVALHQTALQEIHFWAASPWWVSDWFLPSPRTHTSFHPYETECLLFTLVKLLQLLQEHMNAFANSVKSAILSITNLCVCVLLQRLCLQSWMLHLSTFWRPYWSMRQCRERYTKNST